MLKAENFPQILSIKDINKYMNLQITLAPVFINKSNFMARLKN